MRFARRLSAMGLLVGLLAACAAPEPVLIRPELPAALFACEPAPPKPAGMTGADLANRSNAWAAAYDACQCQLMLVRHLIEGRTIDSDAACGPVPPAALGARAGWSGLHDGQSDREAR
ncbi:MAG: Rz1-like lysis system protein LysC [Kiloniellales bacterium]